jgi:hypothetical protein
MSDANEDASTQLMERLGLDEEMFDKAIFFVGVMMRDINIGPAAKRIGLSVNKLIDKRNEVLRTLHIANHVIDTDEIETKGQLPTTLSDKGVGSFSAYKWGRAVFESLEGHKSDKELAEQYDLAAPEAVDFGRAFHRRVLFFMGAEAVKAEPYITIEGIFDRVANKEDFVELRDLADIYLIEDEEAESYEGYDDFESSKPDDEFDGEVDYLEGNDV